MINKNKKRLLSTLIAALTVCPVVNGMEVDHSTIVPGFQKKGNAYIRELAGPALNQLYEKYEPINNDKIFAGHAGVVSQYKRITDGKIVAVKCIVNPNKVDFKTDHVQYDSIKKEVEFFKKIKEYKDHPGIVNCYDIFSDDKVTYIVQDWIDGKEADNILCELNKNKASDEYLYKFELKILRELYRASKFTVNNLGLYHGDVHGKNILLVPKSPDKANILDRFENFDMYLVDWGEFIEISDHGNEDKKNYRTYFTWNNQKALSQIFFSSCNRTDYKVFKQLKEKIFKYHGKWGRSNQFISMGSGWNNWKQYDFQSELDSEKDLAQSYDDLIKYCEDELKKLG